MARARTAAKSDSAFRTISEVSDSLQVPQHVLRFWETKFDQVRPMKRGGGRRYYRPEDIELLRQIRDCLYADGYTIKGVQKLLREGQLKVAPKASASEGRGAPQETQEAEVLAENTEPEAAVGDFDTDDLSEQSGSTPSKVSTPERKLSESDRDTLRGVLDELESARSELLERTPPRRNAA